MSWRGSGKATGARMVGYQVVVLESDERRVEKLLTAAVKAGVVHEGQWNSSRGFFWWNGVPGAAMRALRDAIGGEPVRNGETIKDAARRAGNRIIAP